MLELAKGRAVGQEKIDSLTSPLENAEYKIENLVDENAKLKQDNAILRKKGK